MVNAPLSTSEQQPLRHADTSLPLLTKAILGSVWLLGRLPLSLRSTIGGAVGYAAGLLPLREQKLARLQLQVFLPEVDATTTVPRMFSNVGRSFMETLNLRPFLRSPYARISCPQWETIESWRREQRPIVALTAHTGNWDLLAAYMIHRGIPIATIGKEARNPNVHRALAHLRDAYGVETIWRSDKSGVKRILQLMKESRVIAALIDQDTRVESVFVPFFGTPAKTPSALVELGTRFNARFVSAFIVRTRGAHFDIHLRELKTGDSPHITLEGYHQHLEEIIRKHPDQWVWFHKRWRTLPNGETLSSRQYISTLSERITPSRT